MKFVDSVLHLSSAFGLQASEPEILVVEFIFSMVLMLLDASLDDEGLIELTPEKKSKWTTSTHDMEIDSHDGYDEKRTDLHERLQKINTVIAIDLIGQLLQNKGTSKILYLACRNM